MSPAIGNDVERLWQQARMLHAAGRLGLAESHYQRLLKLDPRHAEAWHLIGVVAYQSGRPALALKHFERALALRPGHAEIWNNRALALQSLGRSREAAAALERALALRPEYVEAALNLGLLRDASGDADGAEACWRQALAWRPASVEALTNLGNLLRRQHRALEALALLERAHALAATADSAGNLALALADLGRHGEAQRRAEQALSAEPHGPWREVAGTMARLAGDIDRALALLEPADGAPLPGGMPGFELALAREAAGDADGALAAYAAARRELPQLERLRWAEALSVPTMPADEAAVDAALARFANGVDALGQRVRRATPSEAPALLDAALTTTPFALAYLPRDTTGLHVRYADLVAAVVTRALPPFAPAKRPAGARLRVGFVSAYLGQHTVGRYFRRFITGLPAARFERFVWSTGEADPTWARLAAAVEHATLFEHGVPALVDALRDAALDVLVFPDVGMDARQQVLAAARCAPFQVALYGHPVTTGLGTIDAVVVGDALEPPGAESHYREPLWRLPELGAAPEPPELGPERAWLDARRGPWPLLVCAQNLSKLVPEFDRVLVEILARSDARLLLFDRCRAISRRYLARLAGVAAGYGVDLAQRVLIEPARPYAEFLGALTAADLVLDTPWFSGGATSLDAIALGAPLLAYEQGMARGRQSAAMLRLAGVPELIAGDATSYVETALALLADPARRALLGERLRRGAGALFDGGAALDAFAARLQSTGAAAPEA